MTLEVGVSLEIANLREIGIRDLDWEFANNFGFILAEKGDQILYKDKETARLMADLIKSLAILAFTPGGVKFYGLHFQVKDYQHYV